MEKGLPGDRLRLVVWSYRRGGPFRCCTPVWISVASVSWVLAELARPDLVPAIWLPDPRVRAERERAGRPDIWCAAARA
jgi:hypothetical protein